MIQCDSFQKKNGFTQDTLKTKVKCKKTCEEAIKSSKPVVIGNNFALSICIHLIIFIISKTKLLNYDSFFVLFYQKIIQIQT